MWDTHGVLESCDIDGGLLAEDDGVGEGLVAGDGFDGGFGVGFGELDGGFGCGHLCSELGGHASNKKKILLIECIGVDLNF